MQVAAHVANRRDPVGEKQRQKEVAATGRFAGTGEMQVKIGESRNQEFIGAVNNLRVLRKLRRRRGRDRLNFLIGDYDGDVALRS